MRELVLDGDARLQRLLAPKPSGLSPAKNRPEEFSFSYLTGRPLSYRLEGGHDRSSEEGGVFPASAGRVLVGARDLVILRYMHADGSYHAAA